MRALAESLPAPPIVTHRRRSLVVKRSPPVALRARTLRWHASPLLGAGCGGGVRRGGYPVFPCPLIDHQRVPPFRSRPPHTPGRGGPVSVRRCRGTLLYNDGGFPNCLIRLGVLPEVLSLDLYCFVAALYLPAVLCIVFLSASSCVSSSSPLCRFRICGGWLPDAVHQRALFPRCCLPHHRCLTLLLTTRVAELYV